MVLHFYRKVLARFPYAKQFITRKQVGFFALKPGARIAAVIELYDGWTHNRDDADRVVSGYFGSRRYIGGGDRRDADGRARREAFAAAGVADRRDAGR